MIDLGEARGGHVENIRVKEKWVSERDLSHVKK
jgi:hypothetical protein